MFCRRVLAISRFIFPVLITLRTVSACTFFPEITFIQDLAICNDTSLSINFNVTESCGTVQLLLLHIYRHHDNPEDSSSFDFTSITITMRHNTSFANDLCGVNFTLDKTAKFKATNLLQVRLKELGGNGTEICSNNFTLQVHYNGFLGHPVNINSFSNNCSIINVIWDPPEINCGKEVLYYNLSIYDDVNDALVDTVIVNGTSYWFEDTHLFRHRYTYVITGVNELGEGISNNNTFSYQRVPRSAMENTTFDILNYTENNMVNVQYNIPVIIQCTGEAPENATITIQCSDSGIVCTNITEVEYAHTPRDITGSVSVPQYEQCSLIVVFSNAVGSSEPLEMTLDTTPPITTSSAISIFDSSVLPSVTVMGSPTVIPSETSSMMVIWITITIGIIVLAIGIFVAVLCYCLNRNAQIEFSSDNDEYELDTLKKDKKVHKDTVAPRLRYYEDKNPETPSTSRPGTDIGTQVTAIENEAEVADYGYDQGAPSTTPHEPTFGSTQLPSNHNGHSVLTAKPNGTESIHDNDTKDDIKQATSGGNGQSAVVPSHDPRIKRTKSSDNNDHAKETNSAAEVNDSSTLPAVQGALNFDNSQHQQIEVTIPSTDIVSTSENLTGVQPTDTEVADSVPVYIQPKRPPETLLHSKPNLLSAAPEPSLSPTPPEPSLSPTPPEASLTSTAPESTPSSTASELGQVLNDDTSNTVPSINQSGLKAADFMSPGETGKAQGETGKAPRETGEAPGETGEAPGETGKAPREE